MSNKTRLQTNNTNLQALIDKANSLPDADSGGGSGGGSVETCTVRIIADSPVQNFDTYYLNANGDIVKETHLGTDVMMDGITIECVVNSCIFSPQGYFVDMGDMSEGDVYAFDRFAILVKGNGTFVIS